jgi:hypothetical protein
VTAKVVHPDTVNEILGLLGYKYGQVRRIDMTPVDVYVIREDGSTDRLVITTGKSAEDNEGDSGQLGWEPPKPAAKKAARKAPAKRAASGTKK